MLIGNLVAILFSAFVTTVISLIWPDNYDYKSMKEIPMVDDNETGASHNPGQGVLPPPRPCRACSPSMVPYRLGRAAVEHSNLAACHPGGDGESMGRGFSTGRLVKLAATAPAGARQHGMLR